MKKGKLLVALLATVALIGCGEVVSTTGTPTTTAKPTTTVAPTTTAKPTTIAKPTTSTPTTQTPTTNPGQDVCEHSWGRTGVLSATSLTKGQNIKVCSLCGYESYTEIPLDANNSGALVSSGEDAEVNNMDIVRGLKGDCQLTFTYNNKTLPGNNDWAQGRVLLVVEDEGKFVPGTSGYYGKGIAAPLDAGAYHANNELVYHYGWSGDSGVGTWFPGTFTDHAADMDVDVTVTRLDEFVVIRTIGNCNFHENCKNENHFTYRIPRDKSLNVVLGTTFAEVTLKSASLDLTPNSVEEKLTDSIKVEPNAEVSEQTVYTHEFGSEYNQKVTFSFHEGNSLAKEDNQWGHWRGYLWRGDKKDANGDVLTPYPDGTNSTNGTIYTRMTPTQDHYTNWNSATPKWNLEGGINGEKSAGAFGWFSSTDPNFVDNFGALMDDVNVEMTFVKIDRYVFMRVHYSSNLYENTTAYRYFATIVEKQVPALFTLRGEKSTITLNSVKVEKF